MREGRLFCSENRVVLHPPCWLQLHSTGSRPAKILSLLLLWQELLLRVEVTEQKDVHRAGATVWCLVSATLSSGLGHRQRCSISSPSPSGTARLCRPTRGWRWHQICARGLLTAGQVSCRSGTGKWPYFCQISQSCDPFYASSVLLCQIDANWGMTDNSWYSIKCKWCREMIPDPAKNLQEQCGLISVF